MMVLIDQDRGENPYVEVTVRINARDLEKIGPDGRRVLYAADTQTVLDQIAPVHLFLTTLDRSKEIDSEEDEDATSRD